jgi:hypothetical protein
MGVRIPPGAWMFVCREGRVFSGGGLCDELITLPEESYRKWCVWVWSWILDNEEALAHGGGLLRHGKKKSRKESWAEHVARMGDRRGGAYRDLVGKSEGKRPLGRFTYTWYNTTKRIVRKLVGKALYRIDLAHHDRGKWRCKRLRWSRGRRAGLWYPSSRVQTRPKPSDF